MSWGVYFSTINVPEVALTVFWNGTVLLYSPWVVPSYCTWQATDLALCHLSRSCCKDRIPILSICFLYFLTLKPKILSDTWSPQWTGTTPHHQHFVPLRSSLEYFPHLVFWGGLSSLLLPASLWAHGQTPSPPSKWWSTSDFFTFSRELIWLLMDNTQCENRSTEADVCTPHRPCFAWLAVVTCFSPTCDNVAQTSFVKGRTLEKPSFPGSFCALLCFSTNSLLSILLSPPSLAISTHSYFFRCILESALGHTWFPGKAFVAMFRRGLRS